MRIDESTALTQDDKVPADQDLKRQVMAVIMATRAAQTNSSPTKSATFDLT